MINLKSKNCPYCHTPKAVTFSVGEMYEHQCGTTRQRGTHKTIKQSDECKWRVYAASLERERDAAQAEATRLRATIESALLINRTFEIGSMSRVEASHPAGWMPPGKRQQIIAALEAALAKREGETL